MFQYSGVLRHTDCNTVTDVAMNCCVFIFGIRQSPLSPLFQVFHRQRTIISLYVPYFTHSFTFSFILINISTNLAGRLICTAGKLSNKFLKKKFSVTKVWDQILATVALPQEHRSTGTYRLHAKRKECNTQGPETRDLTSEDSILPSLRRREWSCVHMVAQTADRSGWDIICVALSYIGFHLLLSRMFTYLANMSSYSAANSRFAINSLSCNNDLTFQSLADSLRTTRFNIQKFYMVLALRRVFCADLRTNSDFCFILHQLTGFYNRGWKCLLRGAKWFLIESRLRLAFKRLNTI
jgi:hypothetical protein